MQIQQVIVTGQNQVELQDLEFDERLGAEEFHVATQCTFISTGTELTPVGLQALQATANVGQLDLLGSPRAPFDGNLTAVFSEIHLRNVTVRGALEWVLPEYPPVGAYGGKTLPLLSNQDKQAMIFDWVQRGAMQVAPLISHRLPARRVKEGYDGLRHHPETYTGVVLDWKD